MLKVLKPYIDMDSPTPESFAGKHKDSKVLIIGCGPSASKLIEYKDKINDVFDVVIGVNGANIEFEDQMNFHMVMEKDCPQAYGHMLDNGYSRDMPRILNWKSRSKFPKDINYIKSVRNDFDGTVNMRSYFHKGTEGLFIGPMYEKLGLSLGSVTCHGLHFAGILGAKDVYLIGSELMFRDGMDHFYDRYYRDLDDCGKLSQEIVNVSVDGVDYPTTEYFYHSALWLDTMIEDIRKDGINVLDMSDGCLKSPKKIDIDEVFS